jgi:hypothetical protein
MESYFVSLVPIRNKSNKLASDMETRHAGPDSGGTEWDGRTVASTEHK